MHPYRLSPACAPEEPLPRLPVRSIVPQVTALVAVTLLAATALAIALLPKPREPATTRLEIVDAASLIRSFKAGDESAARLRDKTIVVDAVFRELRWDSFGHAYFELGTTVGYEVPVIQCFVAPAHGTAAPGQPVRVRARLIMMYLGGALQADECRLQGAG